MVTMPTFDFDQMQSKVSKFFLNPSPVTFEGIALEYQKSANFEALQQLFSFLTPREKALFIEQQKEFLKALKQRVNIIPAEIQSSTINAIIKALPSNQQAKLNQEMRIQVYEASKTPTWMLDVDEASWKKAEDFYKAKVVKFDLVAPLLLRLQSLAKDLGNGVSKESIKKTLQTEVVESLRNIQTALITEFIDLNITLKKELQETLEYVRGVSSKAIDNACQELQALEAPSEEFFASLKKSLTASLKDADALLQSLIPVKYGRKESGLKYSFIRVESKIYAMALHDYLGEGWYGKVKIAQDKSGRDFAAKIEGIDKTVSNDNENKVGKLIGYFKGHALRSLNGVKTFKERETTEKTYSITELRKGKELFQQIYTNILTKGHVYTRREQDEKRRLGKEALTMGQKLLAGYRSCQVAEELHARNVIHCDLKPANLMALVYGNFVEIKPIDFGFSSKIERDQNGKYGTVQLDVAPNGTPLRYLPREVRVVHPNSREYEKHTKATYSPASDIYSLGIMFRDDLRLASSFYAPMIKRHADKRASLSEMMDRFIAGLEKLPESQYDPEMKKVIWEHKHGVRRVNPTVGPKVKNSYVGQLLSGYRDPQEIEGKSTSIFYTTNDYRVIALSLYSLIKPSQLFKDLSVEYLLVSKTEKLAFLHNAEILIRELLRADLKNEFLGEVEINIDKFFELFAGQSDASLLGMHNRLKAEVAEVKKRKQNHERNIHSPVGHVMTKNIISYLHEDLANNFNPHIEKNAARFASDLKEYQISLMKGVALSEFHNCNYSKYPNKKGPKLPINEWTDFFNLLSERVVTDILMAQSEKHQKRMYKFFVCAVQESIARGDYQSAMAMLSGLNRAPIQRLPFLKEDPAVEKTRQLVEKILDNTANFKAYRQHLRDKMLQGEEVVPYIGVLQRDLTFSAEGNAEKLANGKENEELLILTGSAMQDQFMDIQSRLLTRPAKTSQTNLSSWIKQPRFLQESAFELDHILSVNITPVSKSKPKYNDKYKAIIYIIAQVEQLKEMDKAAKEAQTNTFKERSKRRSLEATYRSYAKKLQQDLKGYALSAEFAEILDEITAADFKETVSKEAKLEKANEKLFNQFFASEDFAETVDDDFVMLFSDLNLRKDEPGTLILRNLQLAHDQKRGKVLTSKERGKVAIGSRRQEVDRMAVFPCRQEVDPMESLTSDLKKKLIFA